MPRILVVDDEPQVRDLAVRAMRQRNFECDSAGDGEAALQLFDQSPYEAVVTDLRMPNKNGHALAVELLNKTPRPQVFVLTGISAPPLVADLRERGVTRVLQKPINFSNLADLVQADLTQPLTSTARKPAPKPRVVKPKEVLKGIECSLQELTEIFADALTGLFEFEDDLVDPPSSVDEFVNRFEKREIEDEQQKSPVPDARRKERVRCKATAIAVPVTKHFARNGEPFRVAIRDLSESGIRLLHTRATNANYLALTWQAATLPATDLAVVARVMRCSPKSPFYDIGGQFVMSD
ncbi:MAG: response regulator [Planctomycetota bacterium]